MLHSVTCIINIKIDEEKEKRRVGTSVEYGTVSVTQNGGKVNALFKNVPFVEFVYLVFS